MTDGHFRRWQELQHELRQAEHRLLLASAPESQAFAGATLVQLQALVGRLRLDADKALQACLAEGRRTRRVVRSVGLHSASSVLDSGTS